MKNQASTSQIAQSTCPYCGVGCGIDVKVCSPPQQTSTIPSLPNNFLSDLTGTVEHPANFGRLCIKGSHLLETTQSAGRMLHPSINGVKASWEKASTHIADKIKSLIDQYGPDSIAFYVSGQLLTEDYYVANKLMKGFIGSANIDTNSRLCMSSAVAAYKRAFGADAVPTCYADLDKTDLLVLVGSNAAWTHPVLFQRMERAKAINPALKVVQIDIRRTATSSLADLHLLLKPGSDAILFNGLLRFISKTKPNNGFIKNASSGYDRALDAALPYDIKTAAKLCELDESLLHDFYQLFVDTQKTISFYSMGINQSSSGVDKANAIINCHLATGKLGTEGSGPFSITGQPNAMGGREVGGMANLLAVHKDLQNEENRSEVAQFWGVDKISPKPGLTATEMFDALESGKLKAVWIACTNPLVSMPNSHQIEKAMANSKFVVVQEISHKSDTLQYADLVLPAAAWLEKEGTMTNSERRISYLPKEIDAPGEARPDVEIFCDFAQRMGFRGFNYNSASEIYDEYASMTKGTNIDVSFLNYDRLKTEGTFQWPVNEYRHKGTPRLFEDKNFYTASQKAIFNIPSTIENTSVKTNDEFPLILTTGRVRDQWHTMTKTGKVSRLKTHYPKPVLEINPVDAYLNKVSDGDITEIKSSNGVVRVRAKITDAIKEGVVFLPMHWGKVLQSNLNRANNPVLNLHPYLFLNTKRQKKKL